MGEADLRVVMVTPRQVKSLPSRYRASGAKSDPADALLLAEVLGTDGHHLAARTPASEPTKILGALSRTRKDLVEARVALASTSSPASWKAGFPAPSGCSVSCTRQPLSRSWAAIAPATPPPPSPRPPSLPSCHCLHDSGRTPASELLRRPQTAPAAGNRPGRGGRTGGLGAGLGDAIQVTSRQERELEAEIIERLEVHADQHIFTSLPRAGHGVRAAALLPRARRRGCPLPYRGSPGRPGWGRAGHHHLGQTPGGQVPLGLRQEATGGAARLRRCLPPRLPWAAKIDAEAIQRTRHHPTPCASWPAPGSG